MKRRGAPAPVATASTLPAITRRRRGQGALRVGRRRPTARLSRDPRRTRRGRRRRRPGPRGRSPRSRPPRRRRRGGAPHVKGCLALDDKKIRCRRSPPPRRARIYRARTPCGRPRFVPATVALLVCIATSSTTSSAPTTPQATSSHTPDTETWSGCLMRVGRLVDPNVAIFPSRPKECNTYRRTGRPARRSWRGRRRARGARRLQ